MTTRDAPSAFPDPHLQPTLTVEAAGAYLGLGRAQAYAAAGRGDIPTMRVGRRILVPTAILARRLGLLSCQAETLPPVGPTRVQAAR